MSLPCNRMLDWIRKDILRRDLRPGVQKLTPHEGFGEIGLDCMRTFARYNRPFHIQPGTLGGWPKKCAGNGER
ncbi:MAG: hypothetical protein ACR2Q4_19170 [Geminicoccaceae bacterium]